MKAEKIILKHFWLLDEIAQINNFTVVTDNKYNSIVDVIRKADFECIKLSEEILMEMKNLISEAKMQKEENVIFHILWPGDPYEEITPEQRKRCELDMLTNKEIFKVYQLLITSVSTYQKGELLLLKYTPALYNVGWSELSKLTRGKVIDIETKEILAYPFDKFFNLNETEENSLESLMKKIERCYNIQATEKLDGSLIIVTRLPNREVIAHTKGMFDNEHAQIAYKYLREKYPLFYKEMPQGLTFMFELISEEDPHIVKTYEKEGLFLLAARELDTGAFVDRKSLECFAEKYSLDIVKEYEYTSLKDFIDRAEKTEHGIEGWVFRIRTLNEPDYFFKLKTEEYLALRRMARKIPIQKIYGLLEGNKLNELLAVATPEYAEDIASTLEEIDILKIKACEETAKIAEDMLERYGLKFSDYVNGRVVSDKLSAHIQMVKEVNSHVFAPAIFRYIRHPEEKFELFAVCKKPMFIKIVKYFEE